MKSDKHQVVFDVEPFCIHVRYICFWISSMCECMPSLVICWFELSMDHALRIEVWLPQFFLPSSVDSPACCLLFSENRRIPSRDPPTSIDAATNARARNAIIYCGIECTWFNGSKNDSLSLKQQMAVTEQADHAGCAVIQRHWLAGHKHQVHIACPRRSPFMFLHLCGTPQYVVRSAHGFHLKILPISGLRRAWSCSDILKAVACFMSRIAAWLVCFERLGLII